MVHVMHTEGRGWGFDANDEFSMELWGNHAIIRPVGELFVKFHDGDEYCWSTVRKVLQTCFVAAAEQHQFDCQGVSSTLGACGIWNH